MNDMTLGAAPKTQPAIDFEFKADRFGFRGNLEIEYAREAVRCVNAWEQAIDHLFGSVTEAITAAVTARILPPYPSWSSTSEARHQIQTRLGSEQAKAATVPDSGKAKKPSQPTKREIIDPNIRDAVEELRLFLHSLYTWAPAFQAGIWAASLAACGSKERHTGRRLLQGLKSVAAVFELDVTYGSKDVHLAFGEFVQNPAPSGQHAPTELGPLLSAGNTAVFSSPGPYSDGPTDVQKWLQRFLGEALDFTAQLPELSNELWTKLDDAYWRQWSWPQTGPVLRLGSPAISLFDLVVTTRYGGLPLVHWRGGNLSICQWSRILMLASHDRSNRLRQPAAAALSNLGFEELGAGLTAQGTAGDGATTKTSTSGTPGIYASYPLIMISPYSASSPAWTWRPEAGIRSFAALPADLAAADEDVAKQGRATATEPAYLAMPDVLESVADRDRSTAALMHAIEVADGETSEAVAARTITPLVWAAWRRIYFGPGRERTEYIRFVQGARNLGELVKTVRDRYPDLFPDHVQPREGPWWFIKAPLQRFLSQSQRNLELTLAWLHRLRRIARV